jgi:enoyl-CoA hydratase/carnithine racemase
VGYQFCRVEADEGVLTVTIDRPERRNALSRSANFELHEIFDAFERSPGQRVAIITGAGDIAFCAGADLKSDERSSIEDAVPSSGFGGLVARFDRAKPIIAAVNGFALGGGFELALACDLVIASDTASFGLPEPRVGLVAGSGGIQRLIVEIGPKRASELFLTGRRVSASDGLRFGFVNEAVLQADLLDTARRYARDISSCSPTAIRAVMAVASSVHGAMLKESMENTWRLPEVQAVFESPDSKEGPLAFAERRPPRWSDLPVTGAVHDG